MESFILTGQQKERWTKKNKIFNCVIKTDLSKKDLDSFASFINFEPYFIFAPHPSLQVVLEKFFVNNLDVQLLSFQELMFGINLFLVDVRCQQHLG